MVAASPVAATMAAHNAGGSKPDELPVTATTSSATSDGSSPIDGIEAAGTAAAPASPSSTNGGVRGQVASVPLGSKPPGVIGWEDLPGIGNQSSVSPPRLPPGLPPPPPAPEVSVAAVDEDLDEEYEREALKMLRINLQMDRKEWGDDFDLMQWYDGLSQEHQRILDKDLTDEESLEIGKGGGFLFARGADQPAGPSKQTMANTSPAVQAKLEEFAGGRSGRFGELEELNLDAATSMMPTKSQKKKLRKKTEKEAAEELRLESNDVVSELALSHSTATSTQKKSSEPKHKKLTRDVIDGMTLKEVKQALKLRGIPEDDREQFKGRPDEQKRLRDYAKTLKTVCTAPMAAQKAGKFFAAKDKVDFDGLEERDEDGLLINTAKSSTLGKQKATEAKGSSSLGKAVAGALDTARSAMGMQTEEEKKRAQIAAEVAEAKRKQQEDDEKKKAAERKEKIRKGKEQNAFKKLGILGDGKPLDDEKVNKQGGSTSKDDGTKLEELD